MLTLYYAPGACSMAAHIVLEESGEKYEEKKIDLAGGEQRTASYLKINPLGRVPVLLLDSGEPLAENTAILPYLGKRFNLWPIDTIAEAKALKFLRCWGEDIGFINAHGAAVGPDDVLYLTDDFGHAVRKCTTDGKVVLTIGTPKKPAPAFSGDPFNRCTHTALSPQGDIYVSDGYANPRVHKYSPDGKLLFSWGEPGTDPGQFNLVHNIACDDEGWVYIADRENHRVQVFDSNGKYETQWHNLMRPCGLFVTRGKNRSR